MSPTSNKEYIVFIRFFLSLGNRIIITTDYSNILTMFNMFTNNALDNMIFLKFCSSKFVLASPSIKGSTDLLMLHYICEALS